MNLNQYASGVAQPGISVQKIIEVSTFVPPFKIQQTIVSEIQTIESKIKEAQQIIDSVGEQKQAVMKAYL